jgi:hypothetical protein
VSLSGPDPGGSRRLRLSRTPQSAYLNVELFCCARFSSLAVSPLFRDSYYARSRLLDHLNSDGFDYWSDNLFHPLFPRSFLSWRAFGLSFGNRIGGRKQSRQALGRRRLCCLWPYPLRTDAPTGAGANITLTTTSASATQRSSLGFTTRSARPKATHSTSSAPQHSGSNLPMPGRPDHALGLARTVCGFDTLYKPAEDPGES